MRRGGFPRGFPRGFPAVLVVVLVVLLGPILTRATRRFLASAHSESKSAMHMARVRISSTQKMMTELKSALGTYSYPHST